LEATNSKNEQQSGSLSLMVANFCSELRYEDLPEQVVSLARTAITDTLGVIVAGVDSEVGPYMASLARSNTGDRTGRMLGSGIETTLFHAGLVNGTLAHAIDFDDDDPYMMVGHPSGPVIAALVSLCDAERPSGKEFLLAYVVGVEIEMRLGAAINPGHYDQGWHATSTLGAIGAALACAKLKNLDREKTAHALGIACSLSSGVKANFGTMTKPLHVGHAAQSGIMAAELAGEGFTSSLEVFEHGVGYLSVFSDAKHSDVYEEFLNLGAKYALEKPGLATKIYPSCSNTHPAIDLYLDIQRKYALHAAEVDKLVCYVSPGTEGILLYSNPSTGLEGKFSMEYCLAVALARNSVEPRHFMDDAVAHPDIQEQMTKVSMVPDESIKRGEYGVSTAIRLKIKLKNRTTIEESRARPKGCAEIPLKPDELKSKFLSCTEKILGLNQAERAFDAAYNIQQSADVVDTLELLVKSRRD